MKSSTSFFDRLSPIVNRIRNKRMKIALMQAIPFWIASLLTGLVAVLFARLFALSEGLSRKLIQINGLIWILTPASFLLAWFMVRFFAKYARSSGIPQVMAAMELARPGQDHQVKKLLSIKVILIKIGSCLVMVLGGGAIGREGPTIQIAGSIFRKVQQWTPRSWPIISKQNMIVTGAAAGLAAAFNTPLGGIVFAIEEITRTHISYFRTALFSAVIIAGLTAQGILGPYLYLGYPNVTANFSLIFLLVLIVGIIGGLSGSGLTKIVLLIFRFKRKLNRRWKEAIYVLFCGLALAALAFFFNKGVLWSGREVMMQSLFTNDKSPGLSLVFLRIIGPLVSFTAGAAGGIFAPALAAGAGEGAYFASFFHLSAGDANLLILSGMVAFLTGVTRTPFTSAILVLEMTDRHSVIFYLMLAAMVASLASLLIDKHSFYHHMKLYYMHEVLKEEEAEKTIEPVRIPSDQPA